MIEYLVLYEPLEYDHSSAVTGYRWWTLYTHYRNRKSWNKLEMVRFLPDADSEQNKWKWNCKLFGNLKIMDQTVLIPESGNFSAHSRQPRPVTSSLDLSSSSNFFRVSSSCSWTFCGRWRNGGRVVGCKRLGNRYDVIYLTNSGWWVAEF